MARTLTTQTLPLSGLCYSRETSHSLQLKVNMDTHSRPPASPHQEVFVQRTGSQGLSLANCPSRVWGVKPDLGVGTLEFRMGTPEGQPACLQGSAWAPSQVFGNMYLRVVEVAGGASWRGWSGVVGGGDNEASKSVPRTSVAFLLEKQQTTLSK